MSRTGSDAPPFLLTYLAFLISTTTHSASSGPDIKCLSARWRPIAEVLWLDFQIKNLCIYLAGASWKELDDADQDASIALSFLKGNTSKGLSICFEIPVNSAGAWSGSVQYYIRLVELRAYLVHFRLVATIITEIFIKFSRYSTTQVHTVEEEVS
ncbi:hypothetical protein BDN70DRAFT_899443 [Pholiota conissans]|uniref:Uncharacterized protein n=1 Tax=Pholiota conissans TaxID=109636 RepID=A0A9P5YRJ6_9AGAR|nr:hypothetical protein BDN70DRAFT_899443 [Pholiota conissans]